jgi:hypothetical protein
MMKGAGQRPDVTAGAAVGNVSGDALLASVLAVIDDDLDQVLVLGHGALNLPVAYLARRLAIDRRDAEDRVARALAALRANAALADGLGNVSRAGQLEHFHALAFRLGLLDWFCAYCGQPLTQPRVGRPRRTCGQRCRQKLARTGGTGWRDSYRPGVYEGSAHAGRRDDRPARPVAGDVSGERLVKLIFPVEQGEDRWRHPHARSRDLAMLLLGFTCPVPVTPGDLAALDCYDIGRSRDSMQVVLFRNSARPTRYVAIPDNAAPTCPVRAAFGWRERLARAGLASGPLFIELTGAGRLPGRARRLTGNQVCEIISAAASLAARGPGPRISPTTPLPAFLDEI